MNYCENCRILVSKDKCPICGKKHLSEVQPNDYICLIPEISEGAFSDLENIFKKNQVQYVAMPYGDGRRSKFAASLGGFRVFVTYECLNLAKNIMFEIRQERFKRTMQKFYDNIDKLNVFEIDEKKLQKKLKIDSVVDLAKHIILNATKTLNAGPTNQGIEPKKLAVSDCPPRGNMVFVYSDEYDLTINDETFTIISIHKTKGK